MYEGLLPDQRLVRRADALHEALAQHQRVSIAGLAIDRAEQIGFYRFLRNERCTEARLITVLAAHTGEAARALAEPAAAAAPRPALHVLAIQDTTQLNLEKQRGRLRDLHGLGVLGDGKSLGFFVHPTLVLEASRLQLLGLSAVRLWSRRPGQPSKQARGYRQLPLEQKESFRWAESHTQSCALLGAGVRVTAVLDREGDAYPLFARLPGPQSDLIVRLCRDHGIAESDEGLFAYLARQPVIGQDEIELRGDIRKPRTRRRARVEYRLACVHLLRPRTWKAEAPMSGVLWAIEVREVAMTVPQGEEPIHWRLLTTHRVESFAAAQQVVRWYGARWYIEQLFRLLKLDGLDLESSQLETGAALRRLAVLALGAALDVLRLLLAERGQNAQPLAHIFGPAEQRCLQALAARLQGRTAKQQNPHSPGTLAWAAWLLARLGGWSGYRSQRPPGPLTFRRGLLRFALLCQGYALATDVLCTP